MNRPEQPGRLMPIPDVQSGTDERNVAIDQVGIKGIKFPLSFADHDGVAQHTIALCNVYVALAEDRKGTHMSRLVALLEERAGAGAAPLSVASLRTLLDDLVARLDAPGGRIELAFPFFVRKIAPVSGVPSFLDYEVRLAGELKDGQFAATVAVAVPVMSLCPASKEISDYGAHNQRSTVTITVRPMQPVVRPRIAAHRRGRGVVRAVRDIEARRREIRHRARVRQSALRRGPGARRRRAAGGRSALRGLQCRGRELRVDPQSQRLRADRARAVIVIVIAPHAPFAPLPGRNSSRLTQPARRAGAYNARPRRRAPTASR